MVRALQIALQRERGDEVLSPEPLPFEPLVFCLDWPREELYRRIGLRVEAMLQAGALEELRHLSKKWGSDAAALGGVGYKQLRPALTDANRLPAAVEEWKRDTRRYAKRQLTWFRHQTQATWLDAQLPLPELVAKVLRTFWP